MRWIHCFFSLILWLPCSTGGNEITHVLVLMSYQKPPYQQVISGLKEYFSTQSKPFNLQILVYRNDEDALYEETTHSPPDVILTLGKQATTFAAKHYSQVPICACMILDQQLTSQVEHTAVLMLEFPLVTQLQWLKKVFSDSGPVAVLYHPQKNDHDIAEIKSLAQKLKLPIHLVAVDNNRNLPELLTQLPRSISALWSFTNSSILTAQTAKHILLYSFRNRIPLVAHSSQWVKAGALYALERDYADLGRQCGEKIQPLLSSQKKIKILETPRKILYSINSKTARHMKIELPSSIVESAYEIY